MNIMNYIYNVPDYPERGITYKDITPLVCNGAAFQFCTDQFEKFAKRIKADVVVSPESKGFMFGCPVATALGIGFVPIRKPNKFAREYIKKEYVHHGEKNYLAIAKDSIKKGQKVIIIDDLLVSGETILTTAKLVEQLGGEVVGICVVAEIIGYNGTKNLRAYNLFKLAEDSSR